MKKWPMGLWLSIFVIALVAIGAIMYGNGQLNFGALNMVPGKVARVANAECPNGSLKQDPYCVFTLEPLEYYVVKDGTNFDIYGPKVSELFTANSWNLAENATFSGAAYSVIKKSFTPITLTFKHITRDGETSPAFMFDYETAKKIQGSRFVEVVIQNSIKLRFNTFNIPDRTLNNE